jgi:NAD(P)-dependent dehydrogenase (short-subunit alcohol dehydrogenase family)
MTSTRTILITGCSSGIRHHVAGGLKKRGWRVFAAARKEADRERLAGEGFEAVRLDYTDAGSIAAALDAVLAKTGGKLDALFNNGGYAQAGALEDLSTDLVRAQFEVNFFGWHELTRRVIPVMRRQGFGRIVFCSSVLGYMSVRYRGAYSASKYAVEAMADTLRLELHGSGIRVVLIEPGPIASRFVDNAPPASTGSLTSRAPCIARPTRISLPATRRPSRVRSGAGPRPC